jgi:hypothetical protein
LQPLSQSGDAVHISFTILADLRCDCSIRRLVVAAFRVVGIGSVVRVKSTDALFGEGELGLDEGTVEAGLKL